MPRQRDDDEDEPRPRKKRRANDDDEERPAKRKRRAADDEDDDRPSSRKRRAREEDEDDDRPVTRRRRDLDQDEEDYDDRPRRKRKKPQPKQQSVLGILSLIAGIIALSLSFSCFGSFAIIPGVVGLGLGVFGFIAARNSRGRQNPALALSGILISTIASVVSIIAIVQFIGAVKDFQDDFKEGMAEIAEEEAKRKVEVAKAAEEVKNPKPGTVMRVNATDFYRAYDEDADWDRADAIYKNKILELTGTFHEVDFSGEEGYIVLLKGGPNQSDVVDCIFAKDPAVRAELAKLVPGSQVRIRGKCFGDGAIIEACMIVK